MFVYLSKGKETDLQFIKKYRPKAEGQHQLRILLHGQVGAGKTSFVNSVTSVLEGRICVGAPVCNIGGNSFTNKVTKNISN